MNKGSRLGLRWDSWWTPERRRRILKGFLFTFLVIFVLFVFGSMATVGATAGYVASLVNEEPIRPQEKLQAKITGWTQTSYAYFRDGTSIGKLSADADRKVVTMDEVSPHLIDALISTEDREFYSHNGINPKAMIRAAYQMVSGAEDQTGGSTITQQLVKNLFLDYRQRTVERKAKEIFLAMRMERFFSKEEIMNAYINSLYFGKNASGRNMLGVQAAAKGLFGVDAKDLNLSQAAYIAGMVQRPNAYNPFRGEENLKNGKKRMREVLWNMVVNKKITEKEYQKARKFDIKGSLRTAEDNSIAYQKYPYVTIAVEDEAAKVLMRADGKDPKELSKKGIYRDTLDEYKQKILTGGYKVTTTLDKKLYEAMNKAAKNTAFSDQKIQVGAALLDVKSGATLAFVGGRDYRKNQHNHALDVRRQPGSTIKPLLDYGPGLDRGVISPDSIIIDEKLAARGTTGHVYRNYNDKYSGPMTAREALMKSMNIPAIKVLRAVGVQTGLKYLEKMNFPLSEGMGESVAIGGFTYGFDVQRMTAGYAMLANQGKFNEPYLISKIEDPSGKVVYEHKKEPVRVMSAKAAYWTTDMLKDVVRKGTGVRIGNSFPGYNLAGKTGTTNDTKDVWFVGYTPEVALGTWVGYDRPKTIWNDQQAKIAWINMFRAVNQADPKLVSGADFPRQPGYDFKCFECKKAEKMKKEEEEKKKKEQQENRPPEPSQPPAPEPGTPPGGGDSGTNGGDTNGDQGGTVFPPPDDGRGNGGDNGGDGDQQGDDAPRPED
ncbi:penicillin-binding protein [Melghirimyces profundicolus]|uniref:Penicillin-binding protein n=1 Tax=Melghirimyces profundicolus TaxID=1242148 RepID=A0A2T6C982_9BACL|nr:transglycosylase domain-containing protein [Melghirimyces profundicolus]PTX64826.1 penicillin-binding protein [Melghirimyces profundicolus]